MLSVSVSTNVATVCTIRDISPSTFRNHPSSERNEIQGQHLPEQRFKLKLSDLYLRAADTISEKQAISEVRKLIRFDSILKIRAITRQERPIDYHLLIHNTVTHRISYIKWSKVKIPLCYQDAISSPDRAYWIDAMDEEMKNLQMHEVYTLHQFDENFDKTKLLKVKWCYALKYNHLGEIIRFNLKPLKLV